MVSAARSLAAVASVLAVSGAGAFTAPRAHTVDAKRASSLQMQPKGCAATPLEKKKVAVFGAGGYLGAVLFGFLQRAGSLYGTGISGMSSPRAICSTGAGAQALNTVLAAQFKWAFAGENLIRLVDTTDAKYIEERVKGFDAAVLGTTYRLEQRPVTPNTYDNKGVNQKAYEIYLDDRYGAWEINIPSNDDDIHTTIFRNSVQACKQAGLSHLVVLETHRTTDPMKFLDILEEGDVSYTYIRTTSPLIKDKAYTFEKGISNKLDVSLLPAGATLVPFDAWTYEYDPGVTRGDLSTRLSPEKKENSGDVQTVNREDLAALTVQSLMTLDWKESRILEVSPSPDAPVLSSGYGGKRSKKVFDKEGAPIRTCWPRCWRLSNGIQRCASSCPLMHYFGINRHL